MGRGKLYGSVNSKACPSAPGHLFGICHFVLENLQMPHGWAGRSYKTAADPGEGPGAPDTNPPPPSDLTLVSDWNSYIDRIVYHFLTGWVFLNKTRIAFCILPMFASARKAVFTAQTATGVHRLRNSWSSLWEVICPKKVQQSFLHQSLHPPIKRSWIRPCKNPTVGLKIRVQMPHPGTTPNCIFQWISRKHIFMGNL